MPLINLIELISVEYWLTQVEYCPNAPLSNLERISRWMDTTHANVLDRSILVKWANPQDAAHALFNKRGEL